MSLLWWWMAFAAINVPILTLLADRMFDLPAPRVIRHVWPVAGIVFLLVIVRTAQMNDPLLPLIGWGALAGFLGSVALDIVRLLGHHLFHAFPMDMPQMFGALAYGLAPSLQRNMIGMMVAGLTDMNETQRRRMLEPRLRALARMPERRRLMVMDAMMAALDRLPASKRKAIRQSQMEVMSELPAGERSVLMAAMDRLMAGPAPGPVYEQPRGMSRIPMSTFRNMIGQVFPATIRESGHSAGSVITVGYIWHFLNGIGFGIAYTLLFGQGSWPLAIAWGLAIWLGMMVVMPVMMPTIAFPWPRFLIVPLIAHVVMVIPFAEIGMRYVLPAAGARSLLGVLF